MVPLIKLIHSENLKIYSRKSTMFMILTIPGMVFLLSLAVKSRALAMENIWGMVADQVAVLFFIGIYTVIIAAGVIANEFNWGTIKLLLIRPVSRAKILLTKYVAVIIFSLLLLVLLFCSSLVINVLLHGWKSAGGSSILGEQGKGMLLNSLQGVFLLYGLKYIEVIIYGTMALMLSAVSKSNALTIGVTLMAMIFGPEVSNLLARYHWSKLILFANLNLTRLISDGRLFRTRFAFSLTVIIVYWLVFMIISWAFFTKRDVLN